MLPFTQIMSPSPFRVYQSTELRQSIATVCLLTTNLASLRVLSLSSRHHKLATFTLFLSPSSQIKHKEEELPFIAQYLISSFDFPKDRALRIAAGRHLSPVKTLEQADSVIHFLKENGLTDADIKSLITWNPQLLSSDAEKTLKPRADQLITAGFAGNIFVELIKNNPTALNRKNTLSKLQFWRSFVNNSDQALLKVIKKQPQLMNQDINKRIIPKINLLRKYGLSDEQMVRLVMNTNVILKKLENIKLILEEAENFGFERGSKVFARAVLVFGTLNKNAIERKMKFLENECNWSEEEVHRVVNKFPGILQLSDENIKSTMDYLLTKFGFDLSSLAAQPQILGCSLKGRIIPRNHVISVLKSKGLKVNYCSDTVIKMTEEAFFKKLIEPYKKEIPGLGESYAAFGQV